jgi:hypothetical protein
VVCEELDELLLRADSYRIPSSHYSAGTEWAIKNAGMIRVLSHPQGFLPH